MFKYLISFSLELNGDALITANDIREAIEILDREYLSGRSIEDFSTSPFFIDSVSKVQVNVKPTTH